MTHSFTHLGISMNPTCSIIHSIPLAQVCIHCTDIHCTDIHWIEVSCSSTTAGTQSFHVQTSLSRDRVSFPIRTNNEGSPAELSRRWSVRRRITESNLKTSFKFVQFNIQTFSRTPPDAEINLTTKSEHIKTRSQVKCYQHSTNRGYSGWQVVYRNRIRPEGSTRQFRVGRIRRYINELECRNVSRSTWFSDNDGAASGQTKAIFQLANENNVSQIPRHKINRKGFRDWI